MEPCTTLTWEVAQLPSENLEDAIDHGSGALGAPFAASEVRMRGAGARAETHSSSNSATTSLREGEAVAGAGRGGVERWVRSHWAKLWRWRELASSSECARHHPCAVKKTSRCGKG